MGHALFKSVFNLKAALREIHSNFQVKEQGDASALRCSEGVIKNAKLLKEVLNRDGLEKTLLSFPNACSDYPRLMHNHIVKNSKPIDQEVKN
jgi:hypothetical protein